jgi:hypothetical protein
MWSTICVSPLIFERITNRGIEKKKNEKSTYQNVTYENLDNCWKNLQNPGVKMVLGLNLLLWGAFLKCTILKVF